MKLEPGSVTSPESKDPKVFGLAEYWAAPTMGNDMRIWVHL